MAIDVRTVSRKTPRDGKLEISLEAALALDGHAPMMVVLATALGGCSAPAMVARMACTCERAARAGKHEHCFLESEVLKQLVPDTTVVLELAAEHTVRISQVSSTDA